jgi:glycosyltransferase involved in cell wall biosynthesis
VQPSDREGFGLPVIEALACGLPVLASDLPVFREIGEGVIELAPVGDPAAWEAAALRLIAQRDTDPAGWEKRRSDGLIRSQRYSWANNARRTAEIYQEILA